jgi:hypothetical protein
MKSTPIPSIGMRKTDPSGMAWYVTNLPYVLLGTNDHAKLPFRKFALIQYRSSRFVACTVGYTGPMI